MQDIVILPTYDRPEMLWLCLEYLSKCPDTRWTQIRIYVDAHIGEKPPRDEIEEVLEKFPRLSIQIGFRHPHQYPGNSYNLMMAYKDAYHSEAERVYLVEDDVLIHPEFFRWHRMMHTGQMLGCSIAVQNPGHGAYASLGVCFKREMLHLILPHCRPAYFQNMRNYCKAVFAPSKFDCEQDGLWARVLAGHPVVWAPYPFAQHVGWYGYHRKKSIRPQGTLDERYAQVLETLTTPAILHQQMRDFGDIVPLEIRGN